MKLDKLCFEVVQVAKQAGDYVKNQQQRVQTIIVEEKGLHDYVTEIDRSSEQMIIEQLHQLLPEAAFIAEENDNTSKAHEWLWIIDPLDGTTNFIHQLPLFTVSIGLMNIDRIVLGVIYEPNLDEMFYAWSRGGAWLNGNVIKVSNTQKLDQSLLATGFPFHNYTRLSQYMQFLEYTIQHTRGLRRLGSAALDLAWVACGRFDGFYEYGLKPWDVAAGVCIIQEAGGHITDFSGGDNYIFGQEIIATNSFIHQQLLQSIQMFFEKKL